MTTTTTRSHLISSTTVQVGDVIWLGTGTLNMRSREVATVSRFRPADAYNLCTATVTFHGEDEPVVMYAGTIYHRDHRS